MSCRWTCTPSGVAPSGDWSALAALAAVGAVIYSPWLWTAQVFLDLAVVGYVLVLRKVARRERLAARRAARAAVREALRAAAERPEAEVHETVAAPVLPHPSVPLAPVAQFRARVVVARTPAPVGWQQSAVVGLDDDDIGFADIDEYQPRRVVNADSARSQLAAGPCRGRLPDAAPVVAAGRRDGKVLA